MHQLALGLQCNGDSWLIYVKSNFLWQPFNFHFPHLTCSIYDRITYIVCTVILDFKIVNERDIHWKEKEWQLCPHSPGSTKAWQANGLTVQLDLRLWCSKFQSSMSSKLLALQYLTSTTILSTWYKQSCPTFLVFPMS